MHARRVICAVGHKKTSICSLVVNRKSNNMLICSNSSRGPVTDIKKPGIYSIETKVMSHFLIPIRNCFATPVDERLLMAPDYRSTHMLRTYIFVRYVRMLGCIRNRNSNRFPAILASNILGIFFWRKTALRLHPQPYFKPDLIDKLTVMLNVVLASRIVEKF